MKMYDVKATLQGKHAQGVESVTVRVKASSSPDATRRVVKFLRVNTVFVLESEHIHGTVLVEVN
jgi:hypothetical protein